MSEWRHIRSLGVERPFQGFFAGYGEGPPGDGEVRLDTLYTGLLTGTELTFYDGPARHRALGRTLRAHVERSHSTAAVVAQWEARDAVGHRLSVLQGSDML